ncbi:MAG TPA: endolytic transglycosylase MltG, partial [Ktedonobacterales bacterium]|nr:endolytic transglycosylase MltG [Ktedonobacterales bacterium]
RGAQVPYALEGYLMPGTYLVDTSSTAADVVAQMLTGLGEALCPGPDPQHLDAYWPDVARCKAHAAVVTAGGQPVSIFTAMEQAFATTDDRAALYDTLTLASIVTRERNAPAEDAGIAQVYYHRYLAARTGATDPAGDSVGFLDAPSTVQYARDTDRAPAAGTWWAPLAGTAAGIDAASPYNTAVASTVGLPPSPIAAPAWDAIAAAATANATSASPAYFLASICGATAYATSAAEFQGVAVKARYEASVGCRSPLLAIPAATPTHLALPAGPLPAIAPAPGDSAAAAFLMNPDTGTVYFAQHATDQRAMASTTKIMTALVAATYGTPDQRITVGPNVIAELAGTGASVAYLQVGDTLTLQELLYGLLLPSGDDAAIAIADGVAGSEPGFVWLMNDEARLLGLTNTHYENVHGLDADGHYSSAADLARLATFALRSPAIAPVVASATHVLPATADHGAYTWTNTNLLLFPPVYPGILGVKTGFTGNAGECLVFAASGPYGRLVGVVLYEPAAAARFADARALLTWGFTVEAHEDAARQAVGLMAG